MKAHFTHKETKATKDLAIDHQKEARLAFWIVMLVFAIVLSLGKVPDAAGAIAESDKCVPKCNLGTSETCDHLSCWASPMMMPSGPRRKQSR